jgi:uncharacterized protein
VTLPRRVIAFVLVLQCVLFLTHLLLYATWTFASAESEGTKFSLKLFLAFLSLTFVPASLLAFRYTNRVVRVFYRMAAIWAGFLSFLSIAAVGSWIFFALALLARVPLKFHVIVEALFALAAIGAIVGLLNASWTRVTRITVRLADLPEAWRGRKAALISDLHLGHVRNGGFLRQIISKVSREQPHAIFIAGDFYDGTAIDATRAAEPLHQLKAPHGVYFVAGNHEQFRNDSIYLHAIAAAGVRVLDNEKVEVDGLQIAGVPYRNAWHRKSLAAVLQALRLDRGRASILLTHAPDHPEIAEAAGVSLQLSGHTHLGQFIPWSWIARRIYRQFVYGLSRIGRMQVFTSSGAGTWGPPLRLGSISEIVLLQFEAA